MLRRAARRFALGQRFDPAKDYYRVLGLAPGAGREQVRRAYIDMVKRFHPDKGTHNDSKIKEINEANEVLSDEALRAEYDLARSGGGEQAAQRGQRQPYEAYRATGQYSNPFNARQRAHARPPEGQTHVYYRDADGNVYYAKGAQRPSRPPPDFDELFKQFAQQFNAVHGQRPGAEQQSAREQRRQEHTARQASPDWEREEYDYQQLQREKEARARQDVADKLERLWSAWRVFRASSARKGFWLGLIDAALHYRDRGQQR